MIENRHLFRAVSAKGGIAAVVWFARALYALAARARRPEERYWVLKGQSRDFYICARPGCHRCTALCVFDSERAAREPLRTLSEPRMFLDTLEFYGASMPSWVREERLLPQIREVSAGELGRIIEAIGVPWRSTLLPRKRRRRRSSCGAPDLSWRGEGTTLGPGYKGTPMYALERAKILAVELDRILEEVRCAPSITAAKTMRPCRLYWAACEAAEAARILETHRRRMELAPEEFEALERYKRIYERASLILLEHFPYPHAQPPPPEF